MTLKDTQKTKTKPQLVAEMDDLRTELRRHIAAETDAARAEEAMWQTQIALLALFNNLPGMAYRTAFDEKSPRGRVEFVSGGCLKLTGYPAAAYVTAPTFYREGVIHPEDRQRVRDTIALAETSHEAFAVTYRIVTKDGQVRWMDEHGTGMYGPQGAFVAREGFITDVTERVMHLHELSRQHTELQKLTRAVEQAGELILIGDATGAVQYVNQAFEDLTGFSRAEVVGRMPRMTSCDPGERNLFHRIRLALQRGDTWRGRYVSRRKDGTLFELECTASPVISPEGHFEGYVAVQREAVPRVVPAPTNG
jgi:PAS domain S-box-containing protein